MELKITRGKSLRKRNKRMKRPRLKKKLSNNQRKNRRLNKMKKINKLSNKLLVKKLNRTQLKNLFVRSQCA